MEMPCSSSKSAVFAIIVAGGLGKRMGSDLPKQFLPVKGKPILVHTVERFLQSGCFDKIVLVLSKENFSVWNRWAKQYGIPAGSCLLAENGAERYHSVWSGLCAIPDEEGIVFVHDGVRPIVDTEFLKKCLSETRKYGNAIPYTSPVDSIRHFSRYPDTRHSTPQNRAEYALVQTPQCCRLSTLRAAYQKALLSDAPFTDEASVLDFYGEKIHLFEGKRSNVKITTPEDLIWAEHFL